MMPPQSEIANTHNFKDVLGSANNPIVIEDNDGSQAGSDRTEPLPDSMEDRLRKIYGGAGSASPELHQTSVIDSPLGLGYFGSIHENSLSPHESNSAQGTLGAVEVEKFDCNRRWSKLDSCENKSACADSMSHFYVASLGLIACRRGANRST